MTISKAEAEPRTSFWPNTLTVARIALAPIVAGLVLGADAVLFARGRELGAALAGAASILFAIAALSDLADGWLARRLNATSPLGAALDHAADKALGVAAGLALAASWLPLDLTVAVLIVLVRDAAIGGLREGLAASGRAPAVGWLGKVKAFAFLAGLSALLFFHWAAYAAAGVQLQQGLLLVGRALVFLAAALAVASGALYVRTAVAKP